MSYRIAFSSCYLSILNNCKLNFKFRNNNKIKMSSIWLRSLSHLDRHKPIIHQETKMTGRSTESKLELVRFLDRKNWSRQSTQNDINFWYDELEYIHEESFFDVIGPTLKENLSQEINSKLLNACKIEEVTNIINTYPEISIDFAMQFICSLSQIKVMAEYNDIMLKENGRTIYNRTENVLFKLIQLPEFLKLLNLIQSNAENLTPKEISSLMISLNYLGVPTANKLMISLHLLALKNIANMDIESLLQLSLLLRNKSMKSYYTKTKLINNAASKLSPQCSFDDIRNLSLIFKNLRTFWNRSVIRNYYDFVQPLIETRRIYDATASTKLAILKALTSIKNEYCDIRLISDFLSSLDKDIPLLSSGQLVTINSFLLYSLEPRNIHYKIQEQASHIFNDSKDLNFQIELLCILIPYSSILTRKKWEKNTLQYIEATCPQQQQNYISHKRLLTIMKFFDISTREQIQNKLPLETQKTNIWLPNLNSQDKGDYNIPIHLRSVDIEQELKHFVIPARISSILSQLMSCPEKNDLCLKIFNILQSNTHQINFHGVRTLSSSINQYFNLPQKNKNPAIVAKVCRILDNSTFELLKKEDSLYRINILIQNYLWRRGSPFTDLFELLTKKQEELISQLNSHAMKKMCKSFEHISYSSQNITDAIATYIVKYEKQIYFATLNTVLNYFLCIAAQPTNIKDFLVSSNQILESEYDFVDCSALISSCLTLCYFKHISEDLIHQIFNTQFLDKLDKEMLFLPPKRRHQIRMQLMQLNRAVCIDYPEYKIPWFHQKFFTNKSKNERGDISEFHREVYQCLCYILDGENCVAINAKSPYHYTLDLLFEINREGKSLPSPENSSLNNGINKRIVVKLRTSDDYCHDSKVLKGELQIERRHLEILGFCVIDLAESQWFSMAMEDHEDRKNLLNSLIYKELSNEVYLR